MFLRGSMFMAAEGAGGSGGGGGGGGAGDAGAGGGDNKAGGSGEAGGGDGGAGAGAAGGGDGGGDKGASEVEALKAKTAALEAQVAAFEAAKEAAAREKMTETERLEADRQKLASEREAFAGAQRKAALGRLGVIESYHDLAPKVDVGTPAGAAELDAWVKARPEIVRAPEHATDYKAPAGSKVAEFLSGKRSNGLISTQHFLRVVGGKTS
jgi:hypothetical protein